MRASLGLTLLTVLVNLKSSDASAKTGIAIAPQTTKINCDDLNTITSPVWRYNFHAISTFERSHCTQLRTDIEFVPMIWGWYNQNLSAIPIPEDTTTILGFNEPNIKSQSNIEPAIAVQGWKAIQTTFYDKLLVSPSASPCNGSQCIDNFGSQEAWFDEFFRICNGTCRVDYMAVHFYWCYPLDGKNVSDWIGALHDLYDRYGYPLWLTEFNCWNGTAVQQKAFMEEVIPIMESTDWIAKYAWFIARDYVYNSDWQLLTQNTSESKLTPLGETYNKYSLSPTSFPSDSPITPQTDAPTTQSTDATTTAPSNVSTLVPSTDTNAESTSYVISMNMKECSGEDTCDLNEDAVHRLVLVALGEDVNILHTDIMDHTVVIQLSVPTSNRQLSAEYIGKQIEKEAEEEYGDVSVDVKPKEPILDPNDDESSNKIIIATIITCVSVCCCAVGILYGLRQRQLLVKMMKEANDHMAPMADDVSSAKTTTDVCANTNTNTIDVDKDRLSYIASTHDLPVEPQEDDDSNENKVDVPTIVKQELEVGHEENMRTEGSQTDSDSGVSGMYNAGDPSGVHVTITGGGDVKADTKGDTTGGVEVETTGQ